MIMVKDKEKDETVAKDEVEDDNVEEEEEEEDDYVEGDDVEHDGGEEEDRSKDLDPHIVRACTVEMHLKISQEPLVTEVDRNNAAPEKQGLHFVRACAVKMSHAMRKFRGKNRAPKCMFVASLHT